MPILALLLLLLLLLLELVLEEAHPLPVQRGVPQQSISGRGDPVTEVLVDEGPGSLDDPASAISNPVDAFPVGTRLPDDRPADNLVLRPGPNVSEDNEPHGVFLCRQVGGGGGGAAAGVRVAHVVRGPPGPSLLMVFAVVHFYKTENRN